MKPLKMIIVILAILWMLVPIISYVEVNIFSQNFSEANFYNYLRQNSFEVLLFNIGISVGAVIYWKELKYREMTK